jgi:hypothetical protein
MARIIPAGCGSERKYRGKVKRFAASGYRKDPKGTAKDARAKGTVTEESVAGHG